MYHVDEDMNFHKALRYFSNGMRITEGIAPACYYAIEGNLAMLYYLRTDLKDLCIRRTSGLRQRAWA